MFTKKSPWIIPCLILLGLVWGCVSIRSISIDNLFPEGDTAVTSKASGIGVLHLITPKAEELEDHVIADLRAKGATKNVRLRLEMRDFLFVVQLYEVFGQGEM
jgi:hypothetical protein